MRPSIALFAVAVFLGSVVGAGAGVMVFGTEVGLTLDAPAPENPATTQVPEPSPSEEPGTTQSPEEPGVADRSVSDLEHNLTRLYDRTADSVVQLRVTTLAGPSQGSGFLYDDRYVVTNEHVVADARAVAVQFSDGIWRTGRVIGTDAYTDLAVIEVRTIPDSATPLPIAEVLPEPGQFVAAFGSPYGLEGTITHGIVSGVNRSMQVGDGFSIPDTVQTDAPINPGNSGGPLVSMDGTVVGVNRAKSGDNIGFAISAHVIERVVPELIEEGHVEHSFMGIRSIPVTPTVAEEHGLDEATGIAVVQVLEDGPADGVLEAGTWETGEVPSDADIILAIDDTRIRSHEDLNRHLLFHTKPGDTITLTVYRDGERIELEMELGERPPP